MVRPIRLAKPCSSIKRYQYSRLGSRSVARKRHVQSESALIFAVPPAKILLNSGVVAISTVNLLPTLSFAGGRLVHRITLSTVGSPDATPCGKRSRRSRAGVASLPAQPFVVASAIPAAVVVKNARRVIFMSLPSCFSSHYCVSGFDMVLQSNSVSIDVPQDVLSICVFAFA